MKYHRIRRISEIEYYLAEQESRVNPSMKKLEFCSKSMPVPYTRSPQPTRDVNYAEYFSFYNTMRRYSKRVSSMDVVKLTTELYNFLKEDGLIADSLTEAVMLLVDIDTRAFTILVGLQKVYHDCFMLEDVDFLLNKDNWLRTLEVWAFLRGYKTPWDIDGLIPKTHEDWVTMYAELVFILHIPHLYVSEDNSKSKFIYKLKQRLTEMEDEIEKLKQEIEQKEQERQDAEDVTKKIERDLSSQYYKNMRKVSADYNKIIAAQAKELERLRSLLPEEIIDGVIEEDLFYEKENPTNYTLPEYGVTFVGGTPAMLNRLKEQHPDWDFIETDTYPDKYPNNEFCFVNVSIIPHKQFYHIKANCPSAVLCCNLTNISRIEEELKVQYTKYILGRLG